VVKNTYNHTLHYDIEKIIILTSFLLKARLRTPSHPAR
jgi:hypothetical protein